MYSFGTDARVIDKAWGEFYCVPQSVVKPDGSFKAGMETKEIHFSWHLS